MYVMNFKSLLLHFLIVLIPTVGMAQIRDVARIDYTSLPMSDATEMQRFKATLNAPIPMKKEGRYFFIGSDYSNLNLQLRQRTDLDLEKVRELHKLNINLGYTEKWKNDWRFGLSVSPEFSTNESLKQLSTSFMAVTAQLLFVKDNTENNAVEKPYKLLVGLTYSSNSTLPFPLPLVSYYRKFSSNWSYSLGAPKSNLQYFFSQADRLKLFTQLDGFNSMLTNAADAQGDHEVDRLNVTLILSGLQYEHYFTKHLQAYARAGYIWSERIKFRDGKNDVLQLTGPNRLYLRTGIRFKI